MADAKSNSPTQKAVTTSKTSKTHPTENKVYWQHSIVVGFEVNNPKAFKCVKKEIANDSFGGAYGVMVDVCTQDLLIDPGHAFCYLVEGDKVTNFLSFGPAGGDFKAAIGGQGTPNYPIPQKTKLFRIIISQSIYVALMKDISAMRQKITDGTEPYRGLSNDTCAETVRQVLAKHISKLPIGHSNVSLNILTPVHAVTPYGWHDNFKKAKYTEYEIDADGDLWRDIMKGDSTEDPLVGR